MPIAKKWSDYKKKNVQDEINLYAVYELGNSEEVLYIGEGQLKVRLMAHFPDGKEPVIGASGYRYELTGSKKKAVQRQNALLADFFKTHKRLPKYNQQKKA